MDAIKKMYGCSKEVVDYLKLVPACSKHRQEIERKMTVLTNIMEHVKGSSDLHVPSTCKTAFEQCMASLTTCKMTCDDMRSQRIMGKVVYAKENIQKVEKLDKELTYVVQNMGLFLQCMVAAKIDGVSETLCKVNKGVGDISRKIDETAHRLECVVSNPESASLGIYPGVSNCSSMVKPKVPDEPKATVQGDVMVIKWNHTHEECPSQLIDKYEVCFETAHSKPFTLSGKPQDLKIRSNEDGYFYSMGVGSPKIIAGQKYTIKVRAIFKDAGPSKWSKPEVCRFKTGPPNKPRKPKVTVDSPENITISVEPLHEDDENGSPVRECIVMQDEKEFPAVSMDKFPVTIPAEPDTQLSIMVKMVNAAGQSPPSDAVEVCTPELLPGAPVNVRISSVRKRDAMKLLWDPPVENTKAAVMYEVEMRPSKRKKPIEWYRVKHEVKKLSAKVANLKPHKKYKFRVRALNNKGHASPNAYSAEVEGETRRGVGMAVLAATGAFIGGTLGGPVLGMMAIGALSGDAAAQKVNNKAGSAAAGVAAGVGGGIAGAIAGVVGAPLIGLGLAKGAYDSVSGDQDRMSPPSSEDESIGY